MGVNGRDSVGRSIPRTLLRRSCRCGSIYGDLVGDDKGKRSSGRSKPAMLDLDSLVLILILPVSAERVGDPKKSSCRMYSGLYWLLVVCVLDMLIGVSASICLLPLLVCLFLLFVW